MFKKDDTVLYSARGVCKIVDKNEEFYTLCPVYGNDISIKIPIANEDKMKKMLSKEEIDQMISKISDIPWIENDKERQRSFNEILFSADRLKIMELIRLLYLHQQELKKHNKKLHIADEKIFKRAESILYDEFSFVLNLKHEGVVKYIAEKIN